MWLTLFFFPPPLPPVPSLPPDPQRSHHAQAVFDFTPHHPSQLRFLRGDVIELIDCSDSVRWRGRCHGRVGYFPPEYVQPIYHCQWPDLVSNKRTAIPSGSPTSHPERHSRCSPALHSPVNFLEQTTELPPNDPFPKLIPPNAPLWCRPLNQPLLQAHLIIWSWRLHFLLRSRHGPLHCGELSHIFKVIHTPSYNHLLQLTISFRKVTHINTKLRGKVCGPWKLLKEGQACSLAHLLQYFAILFTRSWTESHCECEHLEDTDTADSSVTELVCVCGGGVCTDVKLQSLHTYMHVVWRWGSEKCVDCVDCICVRVYMCVRVCVWACSVDQWKELLCYSVTVRRTLPRHRFVNTKKEEKRAA